MGTHNRIILSVAIFGAFAAGISGALAGGALRVPLRTDAQAGTILIGTDDVFSGAAPAYPGWPPEPLYPRAERMLRQAAMEPSVPLPRPVVFAPPQDLPPPYEVWLDGEDRPRRDSREAGWRNDEREAMRRADYVREQARRDEMRREEIRREAFRRDDRRGPPPPVQVYGQDRPAYREPPPGYGPPPPPPAGYRPPPPPPPGYYGPPPRG